MDFIAIDFETANTGRSPCSLGVIIVENNKIVDCKSFLINPYEPFSQCCINVNHITPEMVKSKDQFPIIWEKVKPLFLKYPVVAHNMSFDYDVLAKSLIKYNLEIPKLKLYCTLQLAKNNFPKIKKYKLADLCDYFKVTLANHHCCDDDSNACAMLLLKMMEFPQFVLSEYVPSSEHSTHQASTLAECISIDYEESSVEYDDMLSVSFQQKSFVITGDIEGYSRDELNALIIERGGICKSIVSKKVDYLIVGMQNRNVIKNKEEIKSEKIIKAEKLRADGFPIKIISDEDFLILLHQQVNNKTGNEVQNWFLFQDESDKIRKLKAVGILTPTATECKKIYYCGLYSGWNFEKCEVVGYADSTILVISLFGKPHKIHSDYLKEMQPSKKEAELLNV